MTTPINPDALTRAPQPLAPAPGTVNPPSFARVLRQRALLNDAGIAAPAPSLDEADSESWLSMHWMHAAFLARQSMEQAFAALRGDEA
jgi:hypothetical protein